MSNRTVKSVVVVVAVCFGVAAFVFACGPSGGSDGSNGDDDSSTNDEGIHIGDVTDDDVDAICEDQEAFWDDVDDETLHDVVCRAIAFDAARNADEDPEGACGDELSYCEMQETEEFLEQTGWGEVEQCWYHEFFDETRQEVREQCDMKLGDLEACGEAQRDGFETLEEIDFDCADFDDGAVQTAVDQLVATGDECEAIDECGPCFDDEIHIQFPDDDEPGCYRECEDDEDCDGDEECATTATTDVCREDAE